jgi:hypothetical protein
LARSGTRLFSALKFFREASEDGKDVVISLIELTSTIRSHGEILELLRYCVDGLRLKPGACDLDSTRLAIKTKPFCILSDGNQLRSYIAIFNRTCIWRIDIVASFEPNVHWVTTAE